MDRRVHMLPSFICYRRLPACAQSFNPQLNYIARFNVNRLRFNAQANTWRGAGTDNIAGQQCHKLAEVMN